MAEFQLSEGRKWLFLGTRRVLAAAILLTGGASFAAQEMQTMNTAVTRLIVSGAIAIAALPVAGATAHGGDGSTCSDVDFLNVHVHGDHVIRDYVKGADGEVGHGEGAAIPGGPGPGFHFTVDGLAPGASFCNEKAHPNGFNTPDNVPVPGNAD